MNGFRGFLFLACSAILMARAAGSDDAPLAPDLAFQPSAIYQTVGKERGESRGGIAVTYRIAPGYYLYKDRFRFELSPAVIAVGEPEFGRPLVIEDPFFGKSAIFRDSLVVFLPFAMSVAKGGLFRVRITAQGCAEDRLCYSPFHQEVPVSIPDFPAPTARQAGPAPS
jgi:thiol:disulfide interchange protein DsbD